MSLPSPMSLESYTMSSDDPLSSSTNMSRYSSSSSSFTPEPQQEYSDYSSSCIVENPVTTYPSENKTCLLRKCKATTRSHFGKYPTLEEILDDKASHPYSFSNFVGYLSRNHCLETVEFTKDVSNYTKKYNENPYSIEELNSLWKRILDAYVKTDSPKELNLPCEVKNQLISISVTSEQAPSPSLLSRAVDLAKDMMKENVYLPFISSVRCKEQKQTPPPPPPQTNTQQDEDDEEEEEDEDIQDLTFSARNSLPHDFLTSSGHHQKGFSSSSHSSAVYKACSRPTSCSWQHPPSWNSEGTNSGVLSKSSSSDSLFPGDEEKHFNRGNMMTPPESPHGLPCNSRSRSISSTESNITASLQSGSLPNNNSYSLPMAKQYSENSISVNGTSTTTTMGQYKNHWRKMSKKLKWRRGPEKDTTMKVVASNASVTSSSSNNTQTSSFGSIITATSNDNSNAS